MQAECEAGAYRGYMHFISSAFLQINSRVQVVISRPVCERKNIILPARDGITRDYFYSIFARPCETPNRAVLRDRRFSPDTDIVIDIDVVCADHEGIREA